jgi:hypothetical protein
MYGLQEAQMGMGSSRRARADNKERKKKEDASPFRAPSSSPSLADPIRTLAPPRPPPLPLLHLLISITITINGGGPEGAARAPGARRRPRRQLLLAPR